MPQHIIDYYKLRDPAFHTQLLRTNRIDNKFNAVFLPSALVQLDSDLQEILGKKIFTKSTTILEAGSGDGRGTFMLAQKLGMYCIGIEGDQTLYDESITHQKQFTSLPIKFFKGNFLTDSTYDTLGIPFTSFGIVFNFVSSHKELVHKIVQESHPGTIFLFNDYISTHTKFKGLKFLMTAGPTMREREKYDLTRRNESYTKLHVYMKE